MVPHLKATGASEVHLVGDVVSGFESVQPAVVEAMRSCREFWREFPPRADLAASPALGAHGVSSVPLSTRIDRPTEERLTAACRRLGLDRESLEGLRPWLAAQLVETAQRTAWGIDDDAGIETALTKLATSAGLAIRYEFPDADAAFGLFSSMDPGTEVSYLSWMLDRCASGQEATQELNDGWSERGEDAAQAENDQLLTAHPGLFDHLVTARNARWAKRIKTMPSTSTPCLILVGAGHLVGDRGIPALLADEGFVVTRPSAS